MNSDSKDVMSMYCENKPVMMIDVARMKKYINEDMLYDFLNDLANWMRESLYDRKQEKQLDTHIAEIWKGNEYLRQLAEKKESEIGLDDSLENMIKKMDLLHEAMKQELSETEYELWEQLRIREVDYCNEMDSIICDEVRNDVVFRRKGYRESDIPIINC